MTDDKIISFPVPPQAVEGVPDADPNDVSVDIVGPFIEEHRVTVGGYRVPNLTATPHPDGTVSLCLGGRFGITAPRDEVNRWAWFLANAMAIGAGYSSFGPNSQEVNPYKVRMMGVGHVRTGGE